jgi:hypothetical protein
MITISNSEIQLWSRCPRSWFITYYLGFVPSDEPATGNKQLGGRVAVAMEGFYGYQLDPLAVLGLLYRFELEKHPDAVEDIVAERDLAEIMVSGYLEWLAETGEDGDLEVVATETDLQVPLPGIEGVMLRARMDRVVRQLSDGVLLFADDKTAATFEKHEVLELDPQMKFYALMQHLATRDQDNAPVVNGGMINTLRRVKRTSKSQPPYYQRDRFRYNPDVTESTHHRVRQVCLEIINARGNLDAVYAAGGNLSQVNFLQRTLLRPVPIPHDCKWSCSLAAGLCGMMDDGSDWPGVLQRSGRFTQADPYEYYRNDALRTIREELAKL